MANYYGSARSNYFQVKDKEAFVAHCERLSLGVWDDQKDDQKDGRVGVYGEDEGGWPSSYWDEEANDDVEFDVVEEIQKHLADGEVCILMEAGAEKLRYVAGTAVAFNNKGDLKEINLGQIYDLAKELTDRPDDITPAEY